MKYISTLLAVALTVVTTSCISTKLLAPEYKEQYYLRQDVKLHTTETIVGLKSLYFGPEKVKTISTDIYTIDTTVLKKGCPVRILKIFEINGVDAIYNKAKLQIDDIESKSVTHIVYVDWPKSESLLTTEPP